MAHGYGLEVYVYYLMLQQFMYLTKLIYNRF
jgi:hypothetical protein